MEASDSVEVSINIQSGDTLIPCDGKSIDLLEKTADPSSTNEDTMASTAQIPCTNTKKQKSNQSDLEDVSSMTSENTTAVSCIESGSGESSLQGASHACLPQMDEHSLEVSHQDLKKSFTNFQSEDDNTHLRSCEDPSDVTSNNPEDLGITHEPKGLKSTHETMVQIEEQDGSHIDQQETDVKEVTFAEEKTSLTQDKIFTLIDHIDSEIGRYEALLVNVRKNKKSCIEAESLEMENSLDSSNRVEVKTKVIQLLKPDYEAKRSANSDLTVSQTTLGTSSCPNPPEPLLYQQIYAENRSLAKSNINPFPGPIYKSLEDYPFYSKNIEKHKKIRGLIFTHLRHKSNSLEEKETRLRQEYKEHLDSWRIRVIKLDKRREKKRSRKHIEDELLVSNASVRAQRRGGS
ncbi:DNA-binding protein snt1 [Basidiobolus ranarum]|uniref:DNA-binding protein snt1 n=1 Tax=Basidiobolus ranarum TaxID=34480 RepID=A0ABR2VXD2_9FUNG